MGVRAAIRIEQGCLPSCQTLATIGALSVTDSGLSHLQSLVSRVHEPEGLFQVRFPGDSSDVYVSEEEALAKLVTPDEWSGRESPLKTQHADGDELARVLEVAYARHLKQSQPAHFGHVDESSIWDVYNQHFFHYAAARSLEDFTGIKPYTLIANGGEVPEESSSFADEHEDIRLKAQELLLTVSNEREHYAIIACTVGNRNSHRYLDRSCKVTAWHDHTVATIDVKRELVGLIDPYNTAIEMMMSFRTFFQFFNLLTCADLRKIYAEPA